MNSRDYYKVYNKRSDNSLTALDSNNDVLLDNDTEFNANQFKLYDNFTTDLRISFNPLRQNYHDAVRSDNALRRAGDPNDSGVDMENGNPFDDVTPSKDTDLVSHINVRNNKSRSKIVRFFSRLCLVLQKKREIKEFGKNFKITANIFLPFFYYSTCLCGKFRQCQV